MSTELPLYHRPAHELSAALRRGEIGTVELARAVFERIRAVDEKLHTYLTVTETIGMETAAEVDRLLNRGEPLPPLAGIPIGIKDVICTRGIRTTCASKILEPFVSPYDATVMRKLHLQRIVLTGKLNMDEFAMGSSNENSAFGPCRNPWDTDRVPGGSSGGSAAAVAAGTAIAALGSDTGGSIRQPAAFCGVVGMKPTYGRVSRFGLVAFASSLDQIGPLTKDVTDCALILNAICGHDRYDSTSADVPVPDFTEFLIPEVRGLRIGIPQEYFIEGIHPEVETAVRRAIEQLSEMGAQIEEISLPHTEYAVATYYIIAPAEASSNLARYDGVRYGYRTPNAEDLIEMYRKTRGEGFGPEVKRRIMIGTYALSSGYYDAYYLKAQKVRTLIKQDFDRAFEAVDVILTPVTPTPAFRLGELVDDPLQMYLSDIFTIPANLAGLPGISLPCGQTREGLPIGMQLLGKPFDEGTILRVAYAFEQANPYHRLRPAL
ncbi:MAG: glutamyl-tRNA(Gln) amidotransferase subunit A [Candidatus Poribacteria bacterium]|nr:MAG: glutamyl-tRNA(Gln) amidotransferase subunit A [Candidatus Poribacteria bacterium]